MSLGRIAFLFDSGNKAGQFVALIAINPGDLLFTTVDREVVQLIGGDAKHAAKGIGMHPTKVRPRVVNLAAPTGLVVIAAPAIFAHQAELVLKLLGGEILS